VALVTMIAVGISIAAIPKIMKERDDAYRLEGQMALGGLALQIYMQQQSGNVLPSAEDFVLNESTTLRFNNGVLTSSAGNYVVDFIISPESSYTDARGIETSRAYVASAKSVDSERNPECQWYTLDSSIRHAGGPASDCWEFDD
jgi:hypothetical protein